MAREAAVAKELHAKEQQAKELAAAQALEQAAAASAAAAENERIQQAAEQEARVAIESSTQSTNPPRVPSPPTALPKRSVPQQPAQQPIQQRPAQPRPVPQRTAAALPSFSTADRTTASTSHTEHASVDDYVAKLERLVLELNMELARRDDRPSGNTLEDLSQRILDLNLENLALREQLQHPSN